MRIELSDQTLPEEFIYADDYDNLTTDLQWTPGDDTSLSLVPGKTDRRFLPRNPSPFGQETQRGKFDLYHVHVGNAFFPSCQHRVVTLERKTPHASAGKGLKETN